MSETSNLHDRTSIPKSESQHHPKRTNPQNPPNPPPVCFNCGVAGHFVVACPKSSRENSTGFDTTLVPISRNAQSMASYQRQSNSSFGIQSSPCGPGSHNQQYSNNFNQIHGAMSLSQNGIQQPFNTSNSVFPSNVPPSYHFTPRQGVQFSSPQPFESLDYMSQTSSFGNQATLFGQAPVSFFPPQNLVSGRRGFSRNNPRPAGQSKYVALNFREKAITSSVPSPGLIQQHSPPPEYQFQESPYGTSTFNCHQKRSSLVPNSKQKCLQKPQTTFEHNQKLPTSYPCNISERQNSQSFQANSSAINKISTAKRDIQSISSSSDQGISHLEIGKFHNSNSESLIHSINPDAQTQEDYFEEEEKNSWDWDWEYKAIFQEPQKLETVELAQPLAAGFKSTPVPLLQAWSLSAPSISRYARKDNLKEFTRSIRSSPQWSYLQEDPAFSDEELDGSFIPLDEILAWVAARHESTLVTSDTDLYEDNDSDDISRKRVRMDEPENADQDQAKPSIRTDEYHDEGPPAKRQKNEQLEKVKLEAIDISNSPKPLTQLNTKDYIFDAPGDKFELGIHHSETAKNKTEALLESLGVTGSPKPRIGKHIRLSPLSKNKAYKILSTQKSSVSPPSSYASDKRTYTTTKGLLPGNKSSECLDLTLSTLRRSPALTYCSNIQSDQLQRKSSMLYPNSGQKFRPCKSINLSSDSIYASVHKSSFSQAPKIQKHKFQASFPRHGPPNWHVQQAQYNQPHQGYSFTSQIPSLYNSAVLTPDVPGTSWRQNYQSNNAVVYQNNYSVQGNPQHPVTLQADATSQSATQSNLNFQNVSVTHKNYAVGPKFPLQGTTMPNFYQQPSQFSVVPMPPGQNVGHDSFLNSSNNGTVLNDATEHGEHESYKIHPKLAETKGMNKMNKSAPEESDSINQIINNQEANTTKIDISESVDSLSSITSAEILDKLSGKCSPEASSRRKHESKKLKRPQPKIEAAYSRRW